jgi:putative endonuclease
VTTLRQQHGEIAEQAAVAWLVEKGWRIVARNVKVARDEIDILAVDPGPPRELVCVEVRSAKSPAFGAPEERVDRLKVGRLYRSMSRLDRSVGHGLVRRVDLVVVDNRAGKPTVRHLRRLEPP